MNKNVTRQFGGAVTYMLGIELQQLHRELVVNPLRCSWLQLASTQVMTSVPCRLAAAKYNHSFSYMMSSLCQEVVKSWSYKKPTSVTFLYLAKSWPILLNVSMQSCSCGQLCGRTLVQTGLFIQWAPSLPFSHTTLLFLPHWLPPPSPISPL